MAKRPPTPARPKKSSRRAKPGGCLRNARSCGGLLALFFALAVVGGIFSAVRSAGERIGLLPTRTPTATFTITPTPTATAPPTATPLPTDTALPTATIAPALAVQAIAAAQPPASTVAVVTPVTAAQRPPTATPLPATPTRPPSTATSRPPTATPQSPTATPEIVVTLTPRTPTATPTPDPPTATPQPAGPTAAGNANLRQGPGTEYAVVGGVAAGRPLAVVGRNAAGDWLQLDDGAWIAAFLVSGADVASLPVTAVTAFLPGGNPTPAPAAAAPSQPSSAWRTTVNGYEFTSDCACNMGNIYNCSDFGGYSAQACYLRCLDLAGYDVHDLDRDDDGAACEWNW